LLRTLFLIEPQGKKDQQMWALQDSENRKMSS
jgi:hypothetical protein